MLKWLGSKTSESSTTPFSLLLLLLLKLDVVASTSMHFFFFFLPFGEKREDLLLLSARLLAVKLACARLGSARLLWQSGLSKRGPKLSCCFWLPADNFVQNWRVIPEEHLFLLWTWSCRLSTCTASLGNYDHAGLQDWSYHDNFLAEGKDRNYF